MQAQNTYFHTRNGNGIDFSFVLNDNKLHVAAFRSTDGTQWADIFSEECTSKCTCTKFSDIMEGLNSSAYLSFDPYSPEELELTITLFESEKHTYQTIRLILRRLPTSIEEKLSKLEKGLETKMDQIKFSEKEAELASLRKQVEKGEETVNKRLSDVEEELPRLWGVVEKLSTEALHTQTVLDFENKLKRAQMMIDNLNKATNETTHRNNVKFAELNNEVKEARKMIDKIDDSHEDMKQMKERLEDFKNKFGDLDHMIDMLEENSEFDREDRDEFRTSIKKLQENTKKLEKEKADKTAHEFTQESVTKAWDVIGKLEEEMSRVNGTLQEFFGRETTNEPQAFFEQETTDKQQVCGKDCIQCLHARVENLEHENLDDLKRGLHTTMLETSRHKEELVNVNGNLNALRLTIESQNRFITEIAKREPEVKPIEKDAELGRIHDRIQQQNDLITSLQKQVDEVKKENIGERIDTLLRLHTVALEGYRASKREFEEKSKINSTKTSDLIETLSNNVSQMDSKVESLFQTSVGTLDSLKDAWSEIGNVQNEIEMLKDFREKVLLQVDVDRHNTQDIWNEFTTLKEETLKNLHERLSESEASLGDVWNQCKRNKQNVEESNDRIQDVEESLKDVWKHVHSQQDENKELRREITFLKQALKEANDARKAQIKDVKKGLARCNDTQRLGSEYQNNKFQNLREHVFRSNEQHSQDLFELQTIMEKAMDKQNQFFVLPKLKNNKASDTASFSLSSERARLSYIWTTWIRECKCLTVEGEVLLNEFAKHSIFDSITSEFVRNHLFSRMDEFLPKGDVVFYFDDYNGGDIYTKTMCMEGDFVRISRCE